MRNEGVTVILRFIKVRVSGESIPATGCCWGKRGAESGGMGQVSKPLLE